MPWPKGKPFPPEATAKRIATFMARGRKRRESRIEGGVELWQCVTCKEWLPREDFYADRRQTSGIKSECRRCHTATTIATRDPEKKRETNRRFMRGYQQRPEVADRERARSKERRTDPKVVARLALNAAVRSGAISRPSSCGRCGAVGPVQGHHHDYSKPFDVEWICSRCHGIEHRGPRERHARREGVTP